MHALKHKRIRWSKRAAWVALWLLPVAAFADGCNLAVTLTTANEARVALVIGNSNYKSAPLRSPANDARAIAEKLRGLGFQVTLKLDQDQKSMAESIRVFGNQLKTGGAGLFYYAGHGMQVRGRNFSFRWTPTSRAKTKCRTAAWTRTQSCPRWKRPRTA